jgi:hypothetical protein
MSCFSIRRRVRAITTTTDPSYQCSTREPSLITVAMGVSLVIIPLEILMYKNLLYFENFFSKKESKKYFFFERRFS